MVPIESRLPPALVVPELTIGAGAIRTSLRDGPSTSTRRIVVAGDWSAVREFSDAASRPPSSLYGGLLPRIAGADLAMVNLECPLGGDKPIAKDGPAFRVDRSSAAALARAGFRVATLANNHIFDQSDAGLRATLDACAEAGVRCVGAGEGLASAAAPLFVDVGSMRLGIIAFADTEEGMASADSGGAAPIFDVHVLDRCRDARRQCDQLLAVVHGGKEYAPYPPPYWYDQVLALTHAGVDAIVGHHPHVPQGLVIAYTDDGRHRVPVIFSTGNFVFPPRPPTPVASAWMRFGYMVELAWASDGVASVELIPYRIDPATGLAALQGNELALFNTVLCQLSRPLASRHEVVAWFDAAVEHFWEHEWRHRLAGLTPKMLADDHDGLRHGRSHFRSPAHLSLIDRAVQRKLDGSFGKTEASLRQALTGWFAGTWPGHRQGGETT